MAGIAVAGCSDRLVLDGLIQCRGCASSEVRVSRISGGDGLLSNGKGIRGERRLARRIGRDGCECRRTILEGDASRGRIRAGSHDADGRSERDGAVEDRWVCRRRDDGGGGSRINRLRERAGAALVGAVAAVDSRNRMRTDRKR